MSPPKVVLQPMRLLQCQIRSKIRGKILTRQSLHKPSHIKQRRQSLTRKIRNMLIIDTKRNSSGFQAGNSVARQVNH